MTEGLPTTGTAIVREPSGVTAVVLTYMRPLLATQVVRSLISDEGIAAENIVVVVNGSGGLDDPALESAVRMVRLPENLGPAGGFRAGIEEAFLRTPAEWAYLCEDDIGLMSLRSPRLNDLLERISLAPAALRPIGAVVAYGRVFSRRTGHTVNVVPEVGSPQDLDEVEVSAWGATLVSRRVFDAGVLPDDDWFFAFEDYDFFCRLRNAGFTLLVDSAAARSLQDHKAIDVRDPWRQYYQARNYFALARRHGTPMWSAAHLAYSARRFQLASNSAERRAILHGLWDGLRRRTGKNVRYERKVGQTDGPSDPT